MRTELGIDIPVASAATILLCLLWIGVDVALLGEESGEVLFGMGGTVGKASVVSVIELVRTSHCGR